MTNMNPIVKNEPYKYSWLDKPPIVPEKMALVLYPHDSREHCMVYLQEDTVFPEAIKKWHLDRLVHITLQSFEFEHKFRFPFLNGINQWVDINYKFFVSVKPDREAIKIIIKNNVTDISEPILEYLDNFKLDKAYNPLELSMLEADALQKIQELMLRLTYLKVRVVPEFVIMDDVSKKQIEDDKADRMHQVQIEAIRKKLVREREEAEARRVEAKIAKEKADTERELVQIRHQAELEEQQHNIDKKTKEVAAEKAYQLQQAENAAAIAQAQIENIKRYGIELLAAIDSSYQRHIESKQAMVNLERENKMKDLELAKQKILLIKEMAQAGVIDDMTAGQMTQMLLIERNQARESKIDSSFSVPKIEESNIIISEDGKDDI